MKTRLAKTLTLFSILALFYALPAAANLIDNGNFDEGFDGWLVEIHNPNEGESGWTCNFDATVEDGIAQLHAGGCFHDDLAPSGGWVRISRVVDLPEDGIYALSLRYEYNPSECCDVDQNCEYDVLPTVLLGTAPGDDSAASIVFPRATELIEDAVDLDLNAGSATLTLVAEGFGGVGLPGWSCTPGAGLYLDWVNLEWSPTATQPLSWSCVKVRY